MKTCRDSAYEMRAIVLFNHLLKLVNVTQSTNQLTGRYVAMPTKRGVASLIAMLLLVGAIAVQAQPVAGVQSPWNVIGSGGSIGSSASNTQLSSTAGQAAIGPMSNAAVRVHLGFWYPATTMGPAGVQTGSTPGGVTAFELKQNYPNPFRSQTTIAEAGNHELTWDGFNDQNAPVSSGDYLCQMEATSLDGATTGSSPAFRKQQIMHLMK
jgi:hypothetical protein